MVSSSSTGFPSGHWLAEEPQQGFVQGYRIVRELVADRSAFQSIRIVDTELLGVTLVLDNCLQTSVNDEFAYHEMLVHPALAACGRPPKRVLIIGGGDGGTLRRVLEHPSVRRAVMVEIDQKVVELSRRYLPSVSGSAFDDPRAELIIGDGIAYLRDTAEQFDAIIIDSTDPVGPAAALFETPFYRDVARALRPGGMMATQTGSPLVMGAEMGTTNRRLKSVFPIVRPYLAL
ncbi:MAG: polyamine aminopropyltransferase, partial [Dehalococcoidia bacterium]|nr:polyamine aminopropyltransferase [Dehalococcoidia bacterium]